MSLGSLVSAILFSMKILAFTLACALAAAQDADALKSETKQAVFAKAKLSQEITDMIFSFAELGYQE